MQIVPRVRTIFQVSCSKAVLQRVASRPLQASGVQVRALSLSGLWPDACYRRFSYRQMEALCITQSLPGLLLQSFPLHLRHRSDKAEKLIMMVDVALLPRGRRRRVWEAVQWLEGIYARGEA